MRFIMRLNLKRVFSLILLLTIVSIVYYTLLNKKLPIESYKDKDDQNLTRLDARDASASIYKIDEIILNPNRNWIVNSDVLQYSSYFVQLKNGIVRIESLVVIVDRSISTIRKTFNCLLANSNGIFSYYNVTEVYLSSQQVDHMFPLLGKVVCEFKLNGVIVNTSDVFTAVIDPSRYNSETFFNRTSEVVLPVKYILFQQAQLVNAQQPKRQQVTHCVHMVRDLNKDDRINSLLHWLKMQKQIGFTKVTIYLYKPTRNVNQSVLNEFINETFLSLVVYKLDHADVCRSQVKMVEKKSSSDDATLLNYMLESCLKTCEAYLQVHQLGAFGLSEKVNSNDCYTSYKHLYEIVANYDFDELILPYDSSNSEIAPECGLTMNQRPQKSIYEFASSLFQQFGRNQTACLIFEHVIMLPFFHNFDSFMSEIKSVVVNDTFSTNHFIRLNRAISQPQINVAIQSPKGFVYAKQLVSQYELVKCLNKQLKNTSSIRFNFNRYFGGLIKSRAGKSIFNTNLTETINQHNADLTIQNSTCTMVPTQFGYLSHFREIYTGFLTRQFEDINCFNFNWEYIYLLLSLNY